MMKPKTRSELTFDTWVQKNFQASKEEIVNEFLKLCTNADRQQHARIKQVSPFAPKLHLLFDLASLSLGHYGVLSLCRCTSEVDGWTMDSSCRCCCCSCPSKLNKCSNKGLCCPSNIFSQS